MQQNILLPLAAFAAIMTSHAENIYATVLTWNIKVWNSRHSSTQTMFLQMLKISK